MLRLLFYTFILSALGQDCFAQIAHFGKNLQNTHKNAPEMVKRGHLDPTIKFIANQKQWDKNVLFRADIPNGFAYLLDDGFHYALYEGWGGKAKASDNSPHSNTPSIIKAHGIRVKFKNAQRGLAQRTQTSEALVTKYNYYLGNDERKWATNVPAYHEVGYKNVYEGIDLKVFGQYKTMKYEFHVAPYAETANIKLAYEGAESLQVREKDGFLEIGTSLGKIYEQKPYCYQIIRGAEIKVPAEFRVVGKEVTFHFPQGYDKTHPLVIDPVLVFSTYSGSTADNWGSTATFDGAGNLYSAGIVFGAGFPTTTGAFQTAFGGSTDMGILKFNPTGTALLYSTYLGGTGTEFPHSLIVDKNNNLIVFGTSNSGNFPTSQAAYDRSFGGGTDVTPVGGVTFTGGTDIVLTKFNATASALLASTYVGGSGNDGVINTNLTSLRNYGDGFRGEVIVDTLDFVYVSTTTNSSNFPTKNAAKGALTGVQDAVVFKMRPNLSDIEWSTYLGGSSVDNAYSMKINKNFDLYVTGGTRSIDLRTMVVAGTPSAMISLAQGNDDGYIAWFSNAGICKQITYLGTSNADQSFAIDLDTLGNVYAVGQTIGNYPISPNVYNVPNGGQFIHKVSGNLQQSLLSTRFGRANKPVVSPDISPTAFLVSTCGNLYIVGWGSNVGESAFALSTTGLPVTPDAFRGTTDGNDFYVMILEKDFKSFLYGTFFGGTSSADHVDGGTSRFDKKGIIYHAACASCGGFDDFPATAGVWSATNNSSNCNNGSFKFDVGTLVIDFNIRDLATNVIIQKACKFPVPTKIAYEGSGATRFTWFIDGVQVSTAPSFTHNFPAAGDYVVRLVGENAASCLKADTVTRTFRISQIEVDVTGDGTICEGQNKQLNATVDSTNPFTFTWSPTTGLSNPNIQNPLASPAVTTTYTVTAKDNNNCEVTSDVTVEVIPKLPEEFELINIVNGRGCVPSNFTATYNFNNYPGLSWIWTVIEPSGTTTFPNAAQVTRNVTQAGEITVKLKLIRTGQCPEDFEIERKITFTEFQIDASANTDICKGESTPLEVIVTPTGTPTTYTWTPATGLSNPNIANPIASPTSTTKYIVTGTSPDGCNFKDSVIVSVTLKPELDFDIDLGSDCAKPTTVTFTNKSKNTGSYEWRILLGTNVVATFANPTPSPYNLTKAGKYKIELTGRNGNCIEIFSKEIEVEDNLSLPPNTITPNNDGKNDTFAIAPERIGYKIEIYNRWGAEMFKTDNYKDDWGKDIEAGAYYYYLTSPKGVRCKGWINVMK